MQTYTTHMRQLQKKIRVLDSTLREGEQHPGVSFTNKQRIQIAWMLELFRLLIRLKFHQ